MYRACAYYEPGTEYTVPSPRHFTYIWQYLSIITMDYTVIYKSWQQHSNGLENMVIPAVLYFDPQASSTLCRETSRIPSRMLVPSTDRLQYLYGESYIWKFLHGFHVQCTNSGRANQITRDGYNTLAVIQHCWSARQPIIRHCRSNHRSWITLLTAVRYSCVLYCAVYSCVSTF